MHAMTPPSAHFGPIESFGHAATNIIRPEIVVKFRLARSLGGLFSCSAKNEFSTGCMDIVSKILQCLKSGGIYGTHVAGRVRQEFAAAARRIGRAQLRALLRDGRDA